MCGLLTVIKKEKDDKKTSVHIKNMLALQIQRGRQGFGYVAFDNTLDSYVRKETQQEIESCLLQTDTKSIMFHHRFPTSTPNLEDCAHPIFVSHKELKHDYYLTHNGVISNCDGLKTIHNKLKYEYTTEVLTKTMSKSYE